MKAGSLNNKCLTYCNNNVYSHNKKRNNRFIRNEGQHNEDNTEPLPSAPNKQSFVWNVGGIVVYISGINSVQRVLGGIHFDTKNLLLNGIQFLTMDDFIVL